jgi:polyhydroxyalkanoate synthesis regulator protein
MFSSPMLAQIIRFYGHAMQGMMGSYLEKNIQTFAEIQSRLGDPAKGFSPELWTQFMNGQAPMVQGLMGNYLEQSKDLFVKMQEQMTEQAKSLFPGLPAFMPPKR